MRPLPCLAIVTLLAACGGEAEPPPSSAVVEAPVASTVPEAEEPEEEAPAPVVPTTHELLVLLVSEGPLLPSETRLGEFLETRMRRNHRDVELRAATAEEDALARAILDHAPTGAPPATFGAAHRVLFLRFAAPRTLSGGDLRSGGIDGIVLLGPPGGTPAFEATMEGSWRLENDQWADWLAGLLRDAEAT